ncbi:MAG: hypothetical protein WB689_24060, partial [Xanthobacteraceae bacterium]
GPRSDLPSIIVFLRNILAGVVGHEGVLFRAERDSPGLSLPGEFFLRGLSREAARIALVIELAASDQICETAAKEVDMDKTSGIQSMALSRRTIV